MTMTDEDLIAHVERINANRTQGEWVTSFPLTSDCAPPTRHIAALRDVKAIHVLSSGIPAGDAQGMKNLNFIETYATHLDRLIALAKKGLVAAQPYDHAAEIERIAFAVVEQNLVSHSNARDIAKVALEASIIPQRLAVADTLLSQIWKTPYAYEKGQYHYGFSPDLNSALHEYFYPKDTMTK
jgi:hypothetical protein